MRAGAAGAVVQYAWASPVTVLGLIFAAVAKASGGSAGLVAGVVEAEGGLVTYALNRIIPGFPIAAVALGHVVLGANAATLAATRRHERVHVSQYARWGILLPVLYLASSLMAVIRGGSAYRDNHFEKQAAAGDSPRARVVEPPARCLCRIPATHAPGAAAVPSEAGVRSDTRDGFRSSGRGLQ